MRFKNYPFKIEYEVVNVENLIVWEWIGGGYRDTGRYGTSKFIVSKGEILGQGEITKALQVKVHAISKSAKEK